MENNLLIQFKRNSLCEREHRGAVLVCEKNKILYCNDKTYLEKLFYLRSCAKPLQALSIILSGTYEAFGFDEKDLAICCASHGGSDFHILHVRNLLRKAGISEHYLQCPPYHPLDEEAYEKFKKQNITPLAIHNNCSGKHSGMLSVCKHNGWDTDTYLDFEHPIQKDIKNNILKYSEYTGEIIESRDGCLAPIIALPLQNIAIGLSKVFEEHEIFLKAFRENPFLIGGTGWLDTDIISSTKGEIIAKVGAEGLCFAYNPQNKQSIVVEIDDSDKHARALVMFETMRRLGWIKQENIPVSGDIKLLNGDIIGKAEFLFSI